MCDFFASVMTQTCDHSLTLGTYVQLLMKSFAIGLSFLFIGQLCSTSTCLRLRQKNNPLFDFISPLNKILIPSPESAAHSQMVSVIFCSNT